MPKDDHGKSPMTYIGSSDDNARTNIMGAWTIQLATAAAVGWYIPSLTSFLRDSHW
jgi:hypothetical protein